MIRKLLLAMAVGWILPASAHAQFAQLKIDPPGHDFGKVSRIQILQHKFALQNTGTATLYIRGTTTD